MIPLKTILKSGIKRKQIEINELPDMELATM